MTMNTKVVGVVIMAILVTILVGYLLVQFFYMYSDFGETDRKLCGDILRGEVEGVTVYSKYYESTCSS